MPLDIQAPKDFRRFLRKRRVSPEFILWQHLRNRSFLGLKFRRQHSIEPYIVDFYCHDLHLVIEIDGDSHDLNKQKLYDRNREVYLRNLGYKIIRFSNEDVEECIDFVLHKIKEFVN